LHDHTPFCSVLAVAARYVIIDQGHRFTPIASVWARLRSSGAKLVTADDINLMKLRRCRVHSPNKGATNWNSPVKRRGVID
jgi:hypothetical protein